MKILERKLFSLVSLSIVTVSAWRPVFGKWKIWSSLGIVFLLTWVNFLVSLWSINLCHYLFRGICCCCLFVAHGVSECIWGQPQTWDPLHVTPSARNTGVSYHPQPSWPVAFGWIWDIMEDTLRRLWTLALQTLASPIAQARHWPVQIVFLLLSNQWCLDDFNFELCKPC